MFHVQYFRECIYIGEPLLYGFSGYRVQFRRPRTVPFKRVALYIGGEVPIERATVSMKKYFSLPVERKFRTHNRNTTLCCMLLKVSLHRKVFQIALQMYTKLYAHPPTHKQVIEDL